MDVFFQGFASSSLDIVRKTVITYIRSILEYNSNVWNPSHKYLIDQLENVQHRFTKRLDLQRDWITATPY